MGRALSAIVSPWHGPGSMYDDWRMAADAMKAKLGPCALLAAGNVATGAGVQAGGYSPLRALTAALLLFRPV